MNAVCCLRVPSAAPKSSSALEHCSVPKLCLPFSNFVPSPKRCFPLPNPFHLSNIILRHFSAASKIIDTRVLPLGKTRCRRHSVLSLHAVLRRLLLPHAKPAKNIFQYVIGSNFAGEFAESVKRVFKVLDCRIKRKRGTGGGKRAFNAFKRGVYAEFLPLGA